MKRTVDNVRVRLKCDKNIKRRISRIKKKQNGTKAPKSRTSGLTPESKAPMSITNEKAHRHKARGLSKIDKQYLKRYGDYATTKKTLCLECKFEKSELIRLSSSNVEGKKGMEFSRLKMYSRPGNLQTKLDSRHDSRPPIFAAPIAEKKSKLSKDKQKFSAKKCSELKKVLSSEGGGGGGDKNKTEDKRKSLKDFLSLL